jgi:hypothetical protein
MTVGLRAKVISRAKFEFTNSRNLVLSTPQERLTMSSSHALAEHCYSSLREEVCRGVAVGLNLTKGEGHTLKDRGFNALSEAYAKDAPQRRRLEALLEMLQRCHGTRA